MWRSCGPAALSGVDLCHGRMFPHAHSASTMGDNPECGARDSGSNGGHPQWSAASFRADDPAMTTEQPTAPRMLRRRSDDRVIGGVASGLGDYFNVDPLLIRIGFVGLMVFGGMGIFLYVAAWLLMPDETTERSIAQRILDRVGLGGGFLATALIVIGAIVLINVLTDVADRSGGVPALAFALVAIVAGVLVLRRGEPDAAMAAVAGPAAAGTVPPTLAGPRGSSCAGRRARDRRSGGMPGRGPRRHRPPRRGDQRLRRGGGSRAVLRTRARRDRPRSGDRHLVGARAHADPARCPAAAVRLRGEPDHGADRGWLGHPQLQPDHRRGAPRASTGSSAGRSCST